MTPPGPSSAGHPGAGHLSAKQALGLFRNMTRIRLLESEIAARYPDEEMRCPVHLSLGQEAVPGAFADCVRPTDFAVSTHRGHAHYIAKGGNLNRMIAEIYGKATGCSAGKGGSMHLIDLDVNFMGTSAIVGNSIPVGAGLALSAQLRGTDQISCVFLGDGAIEEGVFYESVNFAAVRSLPVLFLCENNAFSVYSPLGVRQPRGRSIADLVAAIGVEASVHDGNDAIACHNAIGAAMDVVRGERRPYFLEFMTYRLVEHCGPANDDHLGYRDEAELAEWLGRDPIAALEASLLTHLGYQDSDLREVEQEIRREIGAAFDFAIASPFPEPAAAFEGTYA